MKNETLSDEYLKGWVDGKIEITLVHQKKFKEFIQNLRKELCKYVICKEGYKCYNCKIIDKYAEDDLIHSSQGKTFINKTQHIEVSDKEENPYGKDKEAKAVWECLKRMYKEARPSVDIYQVWKSGKGKRHDWFMKYYLPMGRQTAILDEVCKEMKITGLRKKIVTNTLWMGCSPNSSKITWEKERSSNNKQNPNQKKKWK